MGSACGRGGAGGPTAVGVKAGRGPAASWRRDEGEAVAAPHPVLLEVGQRKENDYGGMAENSKQIITTINTALATAISTDDTADTRATIRYQPSCPAFDLYNLI